MSATVELERLPGGDIVRAGLADLGDGRRSAASLVVELAATRLRATGIEVPPASTPEPGHELYRLLEREDPGSAHSTYNALVGRITSFARAAERESTR